MENRSDRSAVFECLPYDSKAGVVENHASVIAVGDIHDGGERRSRRRRRRDEIGR